MILGHVRRILGIIFTFIEGERDNLLGMIKHMKKESLKLEESNSSMKSKILKLKDDLKDSSNFSSDGNVSYVSGVYNVKGKTIVYFRGSTKSKDVRKGQPISNILTFTRVHIVVGIDFGRGPRKLKSSVTLVPES